MPGLRSADRHLFGDAGLELDTKSYAEALAGAGAVPVARYLVDAPSRLFTWRSWEVLRGRRPDSWSRAELGALQAEWHNKRPADGAPRICIEQYPPDDPLEVFSVARALSQPELGADSIFISSFERRNDPRWQWPIHIAASSDDFRALRLDTLRSRWPASTLSDVRELSRDNARNEILIIHANVRDALQQVLASPFPMRAAHVMLLAPTDLRWGDTRSPLATLMGELQAGGVSLVSPESADIYFEAMVTFTRELSHNTPFDVALHRAFAASDPLHVLNFELIHAAALPTTMRVLSTRFRALPPAAAPSVQESTRSRIDLNWRMGGAVRDLASELEARATTFPYARESEGGAAATELSDNERSARRDASSGEVVRTLQADLFVIKEGQQRTHSQPLRVGDQYRLDVLIAPGEEGTLAGRQALPGRGARLGSERSLHTHGSVCRGDSVERRSARGSRPAEIWREQSLQLHLHTDQAGAVSRTPHRDVSRTRSPDFAPADPGSVC